jgi:hypothetical protein
MNLGKRRRGERDLHTGGKRSLRFGWESPGSRSSEPNEGCGTPRPVGPGPPERRFAPVGRTGFPQRG